MTLLSPDFPSQPKSAALVDPLALLIPLMLLLPHASLFTSFYFMSILHSFSYFFGFRDTLYPQISVSIPDAFYWDSDSDNPHLFDYHHLEPHQFLFSFASVYSLLKLCTVPYLTLYSLYPLTEFPAWEIHLIFAHLNIPVFKNGLTILVCNFVSQFIF